MPQQPDRHLAHIGDRCSTLGRRLRSGRLCLHIWGPFTRCCSRCHPGAGADVRHPFCICSYSCTLLFLASLPGVARARRRAAACRDCPHPMQLYPLYLLWAVVQAGRSGRLASPQLSHVASSHPRLALAYRFNTLSHLTTITRTAHVYSHHFHCRIKSRSSSTFGRRARRSLLPSSSRSSRNSMLPHQVSLPFILHSAQETRVRVVESFTNHCQTRPPHRLAARRPTHPMPTPTPMVLALVLLQQPPRHSPPISWRP